MNEKGKPELLQKEIESRLLSSGADFVGFAAIPDVMSPEGARMQGAISIGIAYDSEIVRRLDSQVGAFEKHLLENEKQMECLLRACAQKGNLIGMDVNEVNPLFDPMQKTANVAVRMILDTLGAARLDKGK